MSIIKFNCVKLDKENIITQIGVNDDDCVLGGEKNGMIYKNVLIKKILALRENGKEIKLITSCNKKITIIKNKYFRTDGDHNKDNDLLDLNNCGVKLNEIL